MSTTHENYGTYDDDCPQPSSRAEEVIDGCTDFCQPDFLALAMLAIDQAMVPVRIQDEIEALLQKHTPETEIDHAD